MGSGSGLDADLLDGHEADHFATSADLVSVADAVGGEVTVAIGDLEDLTRNRQAHAQDSSGVEESATTACPAAIPPSLGGIRGWQ